MAAGEFWLNDPGDPIDPRLRFRSSTDVSMRILPVTLGTAWHSSVPSGTQGRIVCGRFGYTTVETNQVSRLIAAYVRSAWRYYSFTHPSTTVIDGVYGIRVSGSNLQVNVRNGGSVWVNADNVA